MADCPTCEYNKQRAQIWRDEVYRLVGHPLPRKENSMTHEEQIAKLTEMLEIQQKLHETAIDMLKPAIEAEREACWNIIFEYAGRDDITLEDESLLKHLADLIRARGQAYLQDKKNCTLGGIECPVCRKSDYPYPKCRCVTYEEKNNG